MTWFRLRRAPRASADASEAAEHASRSLADARNFEGRASRVCSDLAATLRRNHFAEAVGDAMRGSVK